MIKTMKDPIAQCSIRDVNSPKSKKCSYLISHLSTLVLCYIYNFKPQYWKSWKSIFTNWVGQFCRFQNLFVRNIIFMVGLIFSFIFYFLI